MTDSAVNAAPPSDDVPEAPRSVPLHVVGSPSRASGVALAQARGVFGFRADAMHGTLTMTDGSNHGFVRMVVYVHRIGGQAMETPLRMETEAREAWIEEATADCDSRDASVMALTTTLFEAAELPSQRSVRIRLGNG